MTIDHATLREFAAGAALDDLDPAERDALDRHLETCGSCGRLARDLDGVLSDLAMAAPPMTPPAGLRVGVLAALRDPPASAEPTIRSIAVAPAARPARDRVRRWGGLALAAGIAVIAIGLAAENRRLDQTLGATDAALAEAQQRLVDRQTAVTLAVDPAHRTQVLHAEALAPAAHAVVLYRPGSAESVLVATGLPPTPDGHVYQLWMADAAGVHALGTAAFDGSGTFVAPFGVDLGSATATMVTLEPVGGAVGEPGPQVVFGEL